jgi:phenylacetate-CoA ligase
MNPWIDRPVGWLLSAIGGVALSSFGAYVTVLHSPILGAAPRDTFARMRSRAAFYRARARVPAYRRFLEEKGAFSPRRWADVPVMSKDNYIKRHTLEDLCQGGRIPARGVLLDESSGSTGMPTTWVRGSVERASTRKLIQFLARGTLGPETFVLINAFALGPWATGMNISMAMADACVVKSVGPDIDKVVRTMELLGPKYRYVVCGYPPFLKVLVDSGRVDWERFDTVAIVGGEGMSEPMRSHLLHAFGDVISSFGASDLEINVALETPWSRAVRKVLLDRPDLCTRLVGRSDVAPMVFQYDPLQVFVENGPEDHLLFTLNRLQNVSPRIRYDLVDRGRTVTAQEVASVVSGIDVPAGRLPVLFHWGREEHAVAFYGCKITPDHVQAALLSVPALAAAAGEYALRVWEDERADKRLEIVVELMPGAQVAGDEIEKTFFDSLAAGNQDFRESRRMVPAHLAPRLTLEPAGASRLSGQDIRLKKTYVLR